MPRLTTAYDTPFEKGTPGPYIKARITRGDGSNSVELPALLDTGSDITLVPRHTIEGLGLQLVTDDLELHDATGRTISDAGMYHARIEFGGLPVHDLGVAPTDSAIIYIGRDVLDDYIATFDGPRQSATVD